MADEYDARVDQLAEKHEPAVIDWRHDIHQNPELSNREFRTARVIADHLNSLNSLNLDEDFPGGPFPVARAYGHDTYAAMLMGAASVLAEMREEIPGTIMSSSSRRRRALWTVIRVAIESPTRQASRVTVSSSSRCSANYW